MKKSSLIWSIGWGAICLLAGLGLFLFTRRYYENLKDADEFLMTLGAILAPFVSLFAAIMFYRAISAQTESNNIQGRSSDVSIILKLFDYLIVEINDFHYEVVSSNSKASIISFSAAWR